jgi:hypothetical protein
MSDIETFAVLLVMNWYYVVLIDDIAVLIDVVLVAWLCMHLPEQQYGTC